MKISGAALKITSNAKRTVAFLLSVAFVSLQLFASRPADGASIQGKLFIENGKPAIVDSGGKKTPLASSEDSIADTLGDVRLAGKELKLIGKLGPKGIFDVEDFFVVHGNTLYRLIYFCDTCHITTFRPGICMCCQEPTIPTEVPLTDPRVHHEDVRHLPSK